MSNLFGRLLKRDASPQGGPQQQHPDEMRQESRNASEFEVRVEWFDENGVCHSEPAIVRETSPHGLAFTVDEEFAVDQTVWVEGGNGDMTKTVVRHIEPTGKGYRMGAYRVEQERRRSDRQPVAGDANIHWGDAQVGPCDAPVQVRNATEFGLQIECSFPLPIGTIVQVMGDELQCDGSTCYCREIGNKFIIGLHLVRQAYRRNSLDYKGD